jgi:hypothetical protein
MTGLRQWVGKLLQNHTKLIFIARQHMPSLQHKTSCQTYHNDVLRIDYYDISEDDDIDVLSEDETVIIPEVTLISENAMATLANIRVPLPIDLFSLERKIANLRAFNQKKKVCSKCSDN